MFLTPSERTLNVPAGNDDREMNRPRPQPHMSRPLRGDSERIDPNFRRSSDDGSQVSSLSGSAFDGPTKSGSRRGFPRGSSKGSLDSVREVEETMAKTALDEVVKSATAGGDKRPSVRFKDDEGGRALESSGDGGALGVVIQEFLCPLSGELPIDPVAAQDGRTYERTAIQRWIEKGPRDELVSPVTKRPMGHKIFPATQVKNAIERAVKTGAISGPKVERWARRIEAEEAVEATQARAARGDTDAMYHLGVWHQCGKRGVKRSVAKAYDWYQKSADGGNVRGMAALGFFLVKGGQGIPCNRVEGVALITFAACEQGGVDAAAFCLANWYHQGLNGLPQSDKWAIFWLNRVVSGTCSIRDMDERGVEKARELLESLQKKVKEASPFSKYS